MNVFTRKIRGFRLLDLIGVGLLVIIIVGVYLAKTMAGTERADIARIERQISSEKARIRLLQADSRLSAATLARRLGVSRMTVSRVISDPALVLPATREKVIKAIADLDGSIDDTVRTCIYLTDRADFEAVARVHGKWFGTARPACTTLIVSGFVRPEWKVEIVVTAAL